jgi:hypothetical protein
VDFDVNIRRYLDGGSTSKGRKANERYASFDYCYNYFQSFRDSGITAELDRAANVELSCLHLGFYLASWGMLRGSAELLQKSARHLVPAIHAISNIDPAVWDLDAHCYTEPNIQRLMESASTIRGTLGGASDILVTKIMLGVFGNVPAFDRNFRRGFGVSTFGPKALRKIGQFCKEHAGIIEEWRVPTLDFVSGELTQRKYTRAKVIDMVFFIEGASKPPTSGAVIGSSG